MKLINKELLEKIEKTPRDKKEKILDFFKTKEKQQLNLFRYDDTQINGMVAFCLLFMVEDTKESKEK